MTTPTDAELDALLSKHWPAFAMVGTITLMWLRSAMRDAIAKWGQPQAGAGGEPVACTYGDNGYACCEGGPCQADLHNEGVAALPPQAVREPTIQWPKTRDVGRIGDMSPGDFIRVGLDSDNDAYVSVCGGDGIGPVEFCQPGAGGGKSSRTRVALIALMVAMEQDNAEDPGRDWWARRIGGITKGGQHGAE